jgi:hypothetical protein
MNLKFRSCVTLFRQAAPEDSDRMLFIEALDQFYDGKPDRRTLELLGSQLSRGKIFKRTRIGMRHAQPKTSGNPAEQLNATQCPLLSYSEQSGRHTTSHYCQKRK